MFSLFLRPEDTSPSTSCLTPHMKHNHATLQTLHQQEPCRQEQHSLFKTKLISSIVSNHLYKCPDAYKSQTLIRAFSLVPHIGSYKHTCTVLWFFWLNKLTAASAPIKSQNFMYKTCMAVPMMCGVSLGHLSLPHGPYNEMSTWIIKNHGTMVEWATAKMGMTIISIHIVPTVIWPGEELGSHLHNPLISWEPALWLAN